MIKKLLIAFFMGIAIAPAYSQNVFEAGVSIDNKGAAPSALPKVPNIEGSFFDLYYAINFKPLDMLSVEEAVIKKSKRKALILPLNSMIATPSTYKVTTATGKVVQQTGNQRNNLMLQLQKHPNNENLLFAYAVQLKKEKDYKKALNVVNVVLDKNPDNALAHFLKGDILRYKNKLKESVNEYLYAVELNPYLSDAYYNIAKILEILNDKKLAMDYYKMAYKINPNDKEVKNIILKNYVEL